MTTSYNIRAELAASIDTLDEARIDQLLDDLAPYHPATGRSLLGRIELIITLPAENLTQALSSGLAVLERAAGEPVVVIEAMATTDFDALLGVEPTQRMLSVTEAAEQLGVSRQAILQRIDAGTLPATRVGRAWSIPESAIRD